MIYQTFHLDHGSRLTAYIQDSQITYGVYKKKPAMIICPGGAYMIHATRESEPVAIEFMERGFQCFILYYTVGIDREDPGKSINQEARYPRQVLQLMEAMHLIREKAEEWHIDPEQIFVMGFSAGGHVAASLGVRWQDSKLTTQLSFQPRKKELKPAGIVLGYPMLRLNRKNFFAEQENKEGEKQTILLHKILFGREEPTQEQKENVDLCKFISPQSAPFFIWNSVDDSVVDSSVALEFIKGCMENQVPCEYHLFSNGGHGLSLNNVLTLQEQEQIDPAISSWKELAVVWMERRNHEKGRLNHF